ncbi:flagellar biosynthesis protein FlhB [Treponema sp. Marseille-Q3903]|uniref:flagellar biosynthesis protein FlhB n=1 Tax=Treponema sp. Marseille-Q3903 TaxID=2766703 RepID=UPI00165282D8|nr:flagellar biosynthesis protein FlhB [Treponema sp. Marseille-Q3903]MBC6713696.1 flagellar biosynthesis protein FlhB [Treponema sp. Marseille-Q3903]
MAAEDEGRTEEPSEYKLEKARKEGRVAKSQEVSSALILLLCVVTLIFLSKWILGEVVTSFRFYFSQCSTTEIKNPAFISIFFEIIIKCVLPVGLVSAVSAIAGNIIQTKGFIFSLKPIEPKFNKIIPHIGEYLKKTIFSAKGLFNIAKSFGKVAIIVFVAYICIRKDIFVLIDIIDNGDIGMAIGKVAKMAAQIMITVAIIFLAISIPDYFVQRHDFMQEMKMTKQEQKEEYKEMEGDPEVKSKLQQMQRALLQQNIPKAVAESDVVIANPTHFAVALKYDPTIADAPPVVNAKGEDNLAQTIKRIARENDIPIVENRPVARDLYTNVEVGDIIPQIYYKTIAVIYSQLDKFKKQNS